MTSVEGRASSFLPAIRLDDQRELSFLSSVRTAGYNRALHDAAPCLHVRHIERELELESLDEGEQECLRPRETSDILPHLEHEKCAHSTREKR